jgi:putative phosphoribosyl transferase
MTGTIRGDPEVRIPVGRGALISASLDLPDRPSGLVLFAGESGSSRTSPRNRFVVHTLGDAGLGTMLLDLLTLHEEDVDRETLELRFDIDLLAERLAAATRWVRRQTDLFFVPLGYFAASTGAAAALVAAAAAPTEVAAIVSRGGRPDLAGRSLRAVHTPTLLIVGEDDPGVIALNRRAMRQLAGEHELVIIPGATHLFEEPGALEEVASLARDWFVRHFTVQWR